MIVVESTRVTEVKAVPPIVADVVPAVVGFVVKVTAVPPAVGPDEKPVAVVTTDKRLGEIDTVAEETIALFVGEVVETVKPVFAYTAEAGFVRPATVKFTMAAAAIAQVPPKVTSTVCPETVAVGAQVPVVPAVITMVGVDGITNAASPVPAPNCART